MKKLVILFHTASFFVLVFLFIGTYSKATQAIRSEYSPQEYVPNEVLVKFKEDVIGDLIQSKALIQNVIEATRGKIKTYLGQEVATANWEPSNLTNRSFIGDPYLFHIKLPDDIGVDDTISFFKSIPYVKYAEKNFVRHLLTTFPNDLDMTWNEALQVKRQWALYNPDHNRCDIHALFVGMSKLCH
jgi:hypothetical protein